MKDLDFLSGEFFDFQMPKDLNWLLNYYKTPVQIQFLKYYMVFGDVTFFKDHTGINVDQKYLRRLEVKFHILKDMRNTAKKNFEVERLWEIETGRKKSINKFK